MMQRDRQSLCKGAKPAVTDVNPHGVQSDSRKEELQALPNPLKQRELRPVGGEVRLKKVLALRSAIAAGRYDVPSELVAEAILRYKRGQDRTDAPLYSA